MPTTVTPDTFHYVDFDATTIAELTDRLARAVGLGDEVPITIEIDETSPLARSELASVDPVHIKAESGALEDPKVLRAFSEEIATDTIGRSLLRAVDRRNPDFGDAPGDDDLDLAAHTAWDTYTVGRLARSGQPVRKQRWLYAFRNRHGFTDEADAAFERLWTADGLTWAQISELSAATAASNPGALET